MDLAVATLVFILRFLLMMSGGVLGVLAKAGHEVTSWLKDHS